MNFLFLAHCHLMTAESNITCWASGTSREGWVSTMLNLPRAQCLCLLHLLADGFYLHISLQSILFPTECLFGIDTPTALAIGGS